MQVKSTPVKKSKKVKKMALETDGPSEKCIDFLRAFARSYHVQSDIESEGLKPLILN